MAVKGEADGEEGDEEEGSEEKGREEKEEAGRRSSHIGRLGRVGLVGRVGSRSVHPSHMTARYCTLHGDIPGHFNIASRAQAFDLSV